MIYKDRHARVERVCEWCGEKFMARVERVNAGQGRFCSLKHANLYQTNNDTKNAWGIEKGKKYWDGSKWVVHYRTGSNKVVVTSYQRWWWLVNRGELTSDEFVIIEDGNPENIDPSNFKVVNKKQLSVMRGERGAGTPKPTLAGSLSKWWTGGGNYEYPIEFSKRLKRKIKTRDSFMCQCCFSGLETRQLDVHHIDRNKHNNSEDNLVTVCKPCHQAIHGKYAKTNDRIAYYKNILAQLGE